MGQAKKGELKRSRRRERQSTAARLGVQVRAVRERGINPGEAGGLLAERTCWLVTEQERRRAQIEREAEGRLRRALADALVTSVHEVWLQELKRAVSDADIDAINAQWAQEVRRAKHEARQPAGELTAEQVRARVQPRAALPVSRVGVDAGVRVLATVASSDGEVIERVPNPRPLETALRDLRQLSRERSRRTRGSRRYTDTSKKISRLHRRVACIRGHHLHVLTTRLAKTHGEIVVEGLDAAAMLRQKGLTGARARRRGLSDSALGETRRQLAYKTGWYGSCLIVADRWYPSSKTCHACGHVQDIGWGEYWTCAGCEARHQRDDNAAINLARYEPPVAGDSALGPVKAAVKRRADHKTRPGRAGGDETRKGTSRNAGKQPRDGVPAR